jgi:hypothetical protein
MKRTPKLFATAAAGCQHGNGAAFHGVFDESGSVGLGTGECRKEESGFHFAAVGRKSAELLHAHCHDRRHFHATQPSPVIMVPL